MQLFQPRQNPDFQSEDPLFYIIPIHTDAFLQDVVYIAGFGALLSCMELIFCVEGALRDQVEYAGGLIHDPFFLAAALSLSLTCATNISDRIRTMISSSAFTLFFIFAAGIVSQIAAFMTAYNPFLHPIVSSVLGFIFGIGIANTLITWCGLLSQFDIRHALIILIPACAIQWIPLAVISLIPIGFRWILIGICWTVSFMCLKFLLRKIPHPSTPINFTRVLSFSTASRIAIGALLFSFTSEMLIMYLIRALNIPLDTDYFTHLYGLVISIYLCISIGCLCFMGVTHTYRIELFYRALFLMFLIGVGLTSLARIFYIASYGAAQIAFSLILPTMTILALGIAITSSSNPIHLICATYSGVFLGQFFGTLIGNTMHTPNSSNESLVSFALLLLIGITYVVLFPESLIVKLSPTTLSLNHESLEARCQRIAQHTKLSPRETEVFILLAKGRDIAFVAEKLCIAKSTAASHRKSIYRKLDIHTQQQLLSSVEEG